MITKDIPITELIMGHPEVLPVLQNYRLGCIGCLAAHFETLRQGAEAHGIDVDQLVGDLNAVIEAAH